MKHLKHTITLFSLSFSLFFHACGSSGDASFGPAPGVSQGGAQDFGLFRQILEDGLIPGPQSLDDVGFFNEHKINLPIPACDQNVCLHGLFGRASNMISGSNCITVLVGMNTPIDLSEIERPPLNLAIAVDTSGSMFGEQLEYTQQGLLHMLTVLDENDRVTLVSFSDEAAVVHEASSPNSPQLREAIEHLQATGSTNIYDGLRTAFEALEPIKAQPSPGDPQRRVILLSDGLATNGITSHANITYLAEKWALEGVSLTTIGMGSEFDVKLMRELAEVANGNFYFLEDPESVGEVFIEEAESFLFPLAREVEIDIQINDDYVLRGVFGTKQFETTSNGGHIDLPILQMAHRLHANDHEGGRRGGGGAILLELLPSTNAKNEGYNVGRIDLRYRLPYSQEYVEQHVLIDSPLTLEQNSNFFADQSVEKSFVMLNVFVGLQMATLRAASGDLRGALNVLQSLATHVRQWQLDNADSDIENDLNYIDMFIENLRAHGAEEPTPSQSKPEPWPQD